MENIEKFKTHLSAIGDSIRVKTGKVEKIPFDKLAEEIDSIRVGESTTSDDWIGSGNTHIWITLEEGRTSPVLGLGVKGTVTVDWGDGTAPDILTGKDIDRFAWSNIHEYASPGEYIITLSVSDGEFAIRRRGSSYTGILSDVASDTASLGRYVYQNAIKRVEIGKNVTIGSYAFLGCNSLESINITDSVTKIQQYAFSECYSLKSVNIPASVTTMGICTFHSCYSLKSANIQDGVTRIDGSTFHSCYSLKSVNIPASVTSIANGAFNSCYSLESINIPDGVTSIQDDTFSKCYSLKSINIPDGVTSIGTGAFNFCYSLAGVNIPGGVTSIGKHAFLSCYACAYFDFTKHTEVPTLEAASVFSQTPSDYEIRVPASLYDEWIAATNWATYASNIVAI